MSITLEQLITRVEQRLFLAAGLNVQLNVEDGFVEMARHKYTVLVDDLWLDDYMEMQTFTLDGTTGRVTDDLAAAFLTKGKDIKCIFYDQDDIPLPRLSQGTNPTQVRRTCVRFVPESSPNADKVFQIYPISTSGQVHVWFRTRLADGEWDVGDPAMTIPMDAELMILGTAYDYLSSDGSNMDDAGKLKSMFDARLDQLKKVQWNLPISKRPQDTSMHPNRWEE